VFDMNFCAIGLGFADCNGPWWSTKDPMGNWVVVCDGCYTGPRNNHATHRRNNYPEYICVACGCVNARRWFRVRQPAFPPMPDQYVCEQHAR